MPNTNGIGVGRASGAERMRRHRNRCRSELRNVQVDLNRAEIEFLVLGEYLECDQRDRSALGHALRSFLTDAFQLAHDMQKFGTIAVALDEVHIDQLVRRGFLEPSLRQDREAVTTAFIALAYKGLWPL